MAKKEVIFKSIALKSKLLTCNNTALRMHQRPGKEWMVLVMKERPNDVIVKISIIW